MMLMLVVLSVKKVGLCYWCWLIDVILVVSGKMRDASGAIVKQGGIQGVQ